MAWLGPAIGPRPSRSATEVRAAFVRDRPGCRRRPSRARRTANGCATSTRWRGSRLAALGVTRVYGGGLCTFTDREPLLLLSPRRHDRAHGQPDLDRIIDAMTTLTWIVAASVRRRRAVGARRGRCSPSTPASGWVPMLISYAIGALLGAAFLEVLPQAIVASGDATGDDLDRAGRHPRLLRAGEAGALAPLPHRVLRGPRAAFRRRTTTAAAA